MTQQQTLYEFLGVESDASQEEIKTAAQYLAKKFNPARYTGNSRVAARFKTLKLVYNILSDPKKRAAYDAALTQANIPPLGSSPKKTVRTKGSNYWKNKKIIYSAKSHWFAYLKSLLLMLIPAYFLFVDTIVLKSALEKSDTLKNQWLLEFGLPGVLLLILLILLYLFLQQVTMSLMITARQTVAQWGLIFKQQIEMTHSQFEEIRMKQSIMGRLLNFGTLKIRGKKKKGKKTLKISANYVLSPKHFEKNLMRIIKYNAYQRL